MSTLHLFPTLSSHDVVKTVAMVYVQKDLSAVTKAVFDNWDARKDGLNHRYLYVANARVTPREILASVKKRESYSVPPPALQPPGALFCTFTHAHAHADPASPSQ